MLVVSKRECIAMLLAGGRGSRLFPLTQKIAKPALHFGAKYRIIDFTLSNCINSGIDAVGVLTQYQPHVLNEYIGSGQPWDLDRQNAGVHVLPPYQSSGGLNWYNGTADAVFRNIGFIERFSPKYVAVLSGDHIYKMDYSKMLEYHKASNAECTIAALNVLPEEADRFGIMLTDPSGRVVEFWEKPANPKSTLASMGVYIFSWDMLSSALVQDSEKPASSHDFGKDIIPSLLSLGKRVFAYEFEGYWKDAGTIDSLWESNIDLLNPAAGLNLHDPSWKIFARNRALPPHFIGPNASVENSMITEGCFIDGSVDFSILFSGVTIETGAVVRDSVIMPGAVIKRGSSVQYSIVAESAVIGEGCIVGARPEEFEDKTSWGICVIGEDAFIEDRQIIPPRAVISKYPPGEVAK
jgi:glucose-1-phosphate adenylyltransferase